MAADNYMERINEWADSLREELIRRTEAWSNDHLHIEADPTPDDVDAIAPQVLASTGWRPGDPEVRGQ